MPNSLETLARRVRVSPAYLRRVLSGAVPCSFPLALRLRSAGIDLNTIATANSRNGELIDGGNGKRSDCVLADTNVNASRSPSPGRERAAPVATGAATM